MISAAVFCETHDPPRIRGLQGTFRFESCPRVGEQIVLRRQDQIEDLFMVTRVSHEPLMENEAELAADRRAMAPNLGDHTTLWLYVEFEGESR